VIEQRETLTRTKDLTETKGRTTAGQERGLEAEAEAEAEADDQRIPVKKAL